MQQVNQTLVEKANERANKEDGAWKATMAKVLVNVGVAVSAFLTILYLMLLVNDAIDLPSPYGYIFGVVVGVVAIVPAELALIIWRERLAGEQDITKAQKRVSIAAMILAGIFSALTTSSFFSYFLPQLFPLSYMEIAPSLNVGAIIGSWIVFIMAIVLYDVNSRQTKQNLAQAEASQKIHDARMSVATGAAEAIRTGADAIIAKMNEDGVFEADAVQLIIGSLGMNQERIESNNALPVPAMTQQPTAQAVAPPLGFDTKTMPVPQGGAATETQAVWQEFKMNHELDPNV